MLTQSYFVASSVSASLLLLIPIGFVFFVICSVEWQADIASATDTIPKDQLIIPLWIDYPVKLPTLHLVLATIHCVCLALVWSTLSPYLLQILAAEGSKT